MCFLIPLVVGLISALLGYLLGKMLSGGDTINLTNKLDSCQSDKDKLNNKIYLLEKELAELKSNSNSNKLGIVSNETKTEKKPNETKEKITKDSKKKKESPKKPKTKKTNFDAALALAEFGQKVKLDDLKIVEGIGPKIEGLYHEAGIKTWKKLSETTVEKSRAILDAAGSRYAIHNPETWAFQAQLAYEGKWKELKELQDSLNAGKTK